MIPKTIQLFNNEYYVIYQHESLTTIWELQAHLSIADSTRYNQLKHDIKQNGVHDPILFYTTGNGINLVLDGHSRLKACIELKLTDIPTKEIKENFESLEDIRFWIVKNQCQRRNLTPIEKLQLACLHEETISKRANGNLVKAGRGDIVVDKVDTILEIGKLAGISRATVARYKKVINSGLDNIIQKMVTGDLSITSAYNLVQEKAKKSINTDLETNVHEDTQTEPEQTQPQPEIHNVKYVKDIYEGKYLLSTNEVECLIVTKDDAKVKDFVSQQPTGKYAIFIIED